MTMCKHNLKVLLRWLRSFHIMAFVIGVLLFFIIVIGLEIVFDTHFISDQSLVIGFFGILATFIVIGQYTQVAEMRDNFEKEVMQIRRQMKMEYKREVESLQKRVDDYTDIINNEILSENANSVRSKINLVLAQVVEEDGTSKVDEALKNSRKIDAIGQQISENLAKMMPTAIEKGVKENLRVQNQLITYLFIGNHSEVLTSLMREGEFHANNVTLLNGDTKENVIVQFNNKKILFLEQDHELANVHLVNGVEFNPEQMEFLLNIYNEYFRIDANLTDKEKALKQIMDNIMFILSSSNYGRK